MNSFQTPVAPAWGVSIPVVVDCFFFFFPHRRFFFPFGDHFFPVAGSVAAAGPLSLPAAVSGGSRNCALAESGPQFVKNSGGAVVSEFGAVRAAKNSLCGTRTFLCLGKRETERGAHTPGERGTRLCPRPIIDSRRPFPRSRTRVGSRESSLFAWLGFFSFVSASV